MPHVAIVSSSLPLRQDLRSMLRAELGDVTLSTFDAVQDTVLPEALSFPDILFLDLGTRHADAFRLAQQIRKRDSAVRIVLICNDTAYAIQGYSIDAAGFLLYPFEPEEVTLLCTRLKKSEQKPAFVLETDNKTIRVLQEEIGCVIHSGSSCCFELRNTSLSARADFDSACKGLDQTRFAPVGDHILINMACVKTIRTASVVLELEGAEQNARRITLPIDRKTRRVLLHRLMRLHDPRCSS